MGISLNIEMGRGKNELRDYEYGHMNQQYKLLEIKNETNRYVIAAQFVHNMQRF